MFLSNKELKYSKTKFILITFVIILVSYLVYFLSSLAFGLASSYTNAINKWNADQIVMNIDANDNLMMSYMKTADYDDLIVTGEKAKIGIFPAVISNKNQPESERADVYFFGIDNDSFLKPLAIDLVDNEVIVDAKLKANNYEIGDTFIAKNATGLEKEFIIKGFSTQTTFQTAPVVYMNLLSWNDYRYNLADDGLFSGIVIKGSLTSTGENLALYNISDYINTLPGYNAQVLTFSVMIIFLIIIVSIVLGIFIYVLTIQKTSMFGVMKAQGISNFYISSSVIFQTLTLVALGISFGLALTLISGFFLQSILPFAINISFYIVISLAFFLFSTFGALFSVSAVLKIDPLTAIGG